jgi:hypothetical protein
MVERQDGDAAAFFQAMQHSFAAVLAAGRGHPRLAEALAT